ncbi:RagB/SusD family nutrient uptake outer membrane protein [Pleomorphovibrio marinus]|uniref:RagB/SusD family nutrient uptake outer membrane protein n=1 Tax=Pleomorphovibrio marinus TaxID=2164132 RepID=UPI000E0B92B7|nr:RagB/SusD family nutrient uptake outer membrane protein [Pleomorphovibrio marinus]
MKLSNYIIIGLFTGMLTMITLSCGEGLLEEVPYDFISPEQFYNNETDALAAVNAVYDVLQSGRGVWVDELYGRTIYVVQWSPTVAQFGYDQFMQWNFQIDDGMIRSIWMGSYRGINRANAVISRVPEIDMDENLKARIVHEAKFLRAFYYFLLVSHFGDVPNIEEETLGLTGAAYTATNAGTEAEIWQLIESDLIDAEGVLPETYSDADKGRATKGAAMALLAKTYLQQRKWQEAADKSMEVIQSGNYDLFNDYIDNFRLETENGIEHIFSVQYTDGVGEGSMAGAFTGRSGHVNPGWSSVVGEPEFFDTFDPDDERIEGTFLTEFVNNDGVTIRYNPEGGANTFNRPNWRKMNLCECSLAAEDWPHNFNIIRFADVLLMHSEAVAMGANSSQDAYYGINRVRERAGLQPISGITGQELINAILWERFWELAFEGTGLLDLWRQNVLDDQALIDQFVNPQGRGNIQLPRHYKFPIPLAEIDLNQNLTQNPGY